MNRQSQLSQKPLTPILCLKNRPEQASILASLLGSRPQSVPGRREHPALAVSQLDPFS